jgi:hypothetical protein
MDGLFRPLRGTLQLKVDTVFLHVVVEKDDRSACKLSGDQLLLNFGKTLPRVNSDVRLDFVSSSQVHCGGNLVDAAYDRASDGELAGRDGERFAANHSTSRWQSDNDKST